jgi:hypothetical protein
VKRSRQRTASNRLLLIVLALLLGGCGGGTIAETTTQATTATAAPTPADPGKRAIGAFVAAARAGNADSLWRLLSTASKERLGPTLAQFRNGAAAPLSKGVGSFGRFRTIVSERITDELGVVAIDVTRAGKPGVYAAALRLEGEQWKFELGGPVQVRPIGPDPDAREPVVAQIAAAVQGPGGAGTAVMYLDGQVVNPEVRGTSANSTLFANFDPALDPGRHTVVLFASDDREASATAWAFTVEKK